MMDKNSAKSSTGLAFGVPAPMGSQESFLRLKTYGKHTSPESSPCSNEDCCTYRAKGLTQQKGTVSSPKDKSRKQASPLFAAKTPDKRHIRQRHRTCSPPSESDDSSRGTMMAKYECSERVRNRRNNKTPPIPHTSAKSKTSYFIDRNRGRSRSRCGRRSPVSPIRTSKERSRTSNNYGHTRERERLRRRPRTPPSPDKPNKSVEKVPYFADVVRERDRLKKKYKSPSPVVTSSRQRCSKSRTPRRCRSRSRPRTYSRSRSRSRHRKSESDRHRKKRDDSPYKTWPSAPQIITIPVPVPDYSFAFPPYHPPPGWPPMSIRPSRFSYFPHHRVRNSRQVPFNAPLPPMRFMAPYGFDGMPHPNTMPPNRPPGRDVFRYPYT